MKNKIKIVLFLPVFLIIFSSGFQPAQAGGGLGKILDIITAPLVIIADVVDAIVNVVVDVVDCVAQPYKCINDAFPESPDKPPKPPVLPPPTITIKTITPTSASIYVTELGQTLSKKVIDKITGTAIVSGASVKLIKGSTEFSCTAESYEDCGFRPLGCQACYPSCPCQAPCTEYSLRNVVCNFGSITQTQLNDYTVGAWDVRVINPDNSNGLSAAAFTLTSGPPSDPKDPSISLISHGFSLTWSAPDSGLPVTYKIYKTDNLGIAPITVGSNAYYTDNRIKDASVDVSYRIVAVNSEGESAGVVVSNSAIQAGVNPVIIRSIKGNGFTSDTKVYLSRTGNPKSPRECPGFTITSTELKNGHCDIGDLDTGYWDVKIVIGNQVALLPNGFQVSFPEPTSTEIEISNPDLAGGLVIGWVKGSNLYTGAAVLVTLNGVTRTCFNLSSFDYDNNQFSGGSCNLSTLFNNPNASFSDLKITIANDANSVVDIPIGIPNFSCTVNNSSWSPNPSTVCINASFTQTSNCGTTRSATGTKIGTWNPDLSTVCGLFTQTSNCGQTRENQQGTLTCSAVQICQSGVCVSCMNNNVCGPDGCGGTRLCTGNNKICKHDGSACVECLTSGDCEGGTNYCKDDYTCAH